MNILLSLVISKKCFLMKRLIFFDEDLLFDKVLWWNISCSSHISEKLFSEESCKTEQCWPFVDRGSMLTKVSLKLSDTLKDTQRETLFYSIQYKNLFISLTASDIFHVFTQTIKFYTFHCHILKSTDVWTRWFIK